MGKVSGMDRLVETIVPTQLATNICFHEMHLPPGGACPAAAISAVVGDMEQTVYVAGVASACVAP